MATLLTPITWLFADPGGLTGLAATTQERMYLFRFLSTLSDNLVSRENEMTHHYSPLQIFSVFSSYPQWKSHHVWLSLRVDFEDWLTVYKCACNPYSPSHHAFVSEMVPIKKQVIYSYESREIF